MQQNGSGNEEITLRELHAAVKKLDERVRLLEDRMPEKKDTGEAVMQSSADAAPEPVVDWENVTGESQLAWLAVMVSLIGLGFFIRFTFIQDWITGIGQPVILFIAGAAMAAVSDRLNVKSYKKFSIFIALCGYALIALSFYWASLRLGLLSPYLLVFGSLALYILSVAWGLRRGSSVLPVLGFIVAGTMPILALGHGRFAELYVLFSNLLILASMALSLWKDWRWLPVFGSLTVNLMILLSVRHFFESTESSSGPVTGIISTLPGLIIVWSGLVHTLKKRDPGYAEIIIWLINNLLLYAGLKNLWVKVNIPVLLIIPLACNGLLFFLFSRARKESKFSSWYLAGLVLSAAIAMTVLMPAPFDIILISLLSVFLAYLGDHKKEWEFKTLSGVMTVWSLIFLFFFRFGFSDSGELPFLNFRFISFAVAFLCYGFQGKMINNDPSAGKMGPLLGQGLFSLGLLVLLSGISGEFFHLFPAEETRMFSDKALLAITIVIAAFAFVVTYIGLSLRLFFIRILALAMFLILISKMIFLDLLVLRPLFLVISLTVVGMLLGGASILIKNHRSKKSRKAEEGSGRA